MARLTYSTPFSAAFRPVLKLLKSTSRASNLDAPLDDLPGIYPHPGRTSRPPAATPQRSSRLYWDSDPDALPQPFIRSH